MNKKEITSKTLDKLMASGAEKASVKLVDTEKQELNVEFGEFSLFRTTFDTSISLIAIINNKKGSCTINKLDDESIDSAVMQAIEFANSSEQDVGNDIAEMQEPGEFIRGIESPDLDKMYERFDEFMTTSQKSYPKVIIEQAIFDFKKQKTYFKNSNGVDYTSENGHYNFLSMFTAKDGEKSSSFNYTQFGLDNLDEKLFDSGPMGRLIGQMEEHLEPKTINNKFVGDVIITPECWDFILYFLWEKISDAELIKGTSIYNDKLNEKIASEKLTIHSRPLSSEMVNGYPFTKDGYLSKDSTIIDKGVLKSYLLGLYGSLKTDKERAVNDGECWDVEAGDTAFDDMVKSIKKGILMCRFSGGMPSCNGDFSGVAKNSFYIEDGKIQYALSETMVSANIPQLLNNIVSISKERVCFGNSILPWIQFSGIAISGKE